MKNPFFAVSLFSLLVSLSAAVAAPAPAWAHNRRPNGHGLQSTRVSGSFFVEQGGSYSVALGETRYIKNIVVQGLGVRYDSMINVMVNGQVKGTIHFPGSDPSYVVTVEDAASSIEFYHVSGARAQVYSVTATMGRRAGSLRDGALNTAAGLASQAIDLVDGLEDYSSADEYVRYLLPIKKVAGRAYAKANARGDLSAQVGALMVELRDTIDRASTYIDTTFERDAAFETSVALLQLREQIDALLN